MPRNKNARRSFEGRANWPKGQEETVDAKKPCNLSQGFWNSFQSESGRPPTGQFTRLAPVFHLS